MSVIDDLVTISREVGADPEWVLAGGGNTSVKDQGMLFVKASGGALSTITADGFVRMEMAKLTSIWGKHYPDESSAREAQALADLMAARAVGQEAKRPSVETLMHALLSFTFVVHTHPAIVNGITCSQDGEAAAIRVLGGDILWIPTVNPGYILAQTLKSAVDRYVADHGAAPAIILLQNHGLVVAADSIREIRTLNDRIIASIRHHVKRHPDLSPVAVAKTTVDDVLAATKAALGVPDAKFFLNRELSRAIGNRTTLAPLLSTFSPDHIVYAGVEPLVVSSPAEIDPAAKEYRARLGTEPKVVVFLGVGVVAIGHNSKAVATAEALFIDALKVATYAESFGGYRFLPQDQISFIRNWEVESYRARESLGKDDPGST
ncbi:MAG TPA: class II aldolase/adducin family protein [Spirochaetia bacterium]|nr:class II aldolase/adducin family protein [Spirochaetia bacterium]